MMRTQFFRAFSVRVHSFSFKKEICNEVNNLRHTIGFKLSLRMSKFTSEMSQFTSEKCHHDVLDHYDRK